MSDGDSPYAQLGGEPVLRAIIDDFVSRVTHDVMIGFFFRSVNRDRLREMEFQLAAGMLGADVVYSGRSLDEAHAKHRIMGGQFARRTQILRQTLAAHSVPEGIVDLWLRHTESLRHLITQDGDRECD